MLTTFWQTVGGKLGDRWASVSVPALIFWLGGLAAWTYHRGGLHTLASQTRWLNRQTTAVQVTVILTVLLVVAASAVLIDRMTTPVLRLLEGYWPPFTAGLAALQGPDGNYDGHAGITALCSSLYSNTAVHAINFNDNAAGDAGAEALADLV